MRFFISIAKLHALFMPLPTFVCFYSMKCCVIFPLNYFSKYSITKIFLSTKSMRFQLSIAKPMRFFRLKKCYIHVVFFITNPMRFSFLLQNNEFFLPLCFCKISFVLTLWNYSSYQVAQRASTKEIMPFNEYDFAENAQNVIFSSNCAYNTGHVFDCFQKRGLYCSVFLKLVMF